MLRLHFRKLHSKFSFAFPFEAAMVVLIVLRFIEFEMPVELPACGALGRATLFNPLVPGYNFWALRGILEEVVSLFLQVFRAEVAKLCSKVLAVSSCTPSLPVRSKFKLGAPAGRISGHSLLRDDSVSLPQPSLGGATSVTMGGNVSPSVGCSCKIC